MSNKTVSKKNAPKNATTTVGTKMPERKETSMRFPEGRLSMKRAKQLLANIPKDGTQRRSYFKLYSGLSRTVPGPALTPARPTTKAKAA